ncbi:MAG: FtsX-like permease family protein [Candidatus Cloacimonetes bacterium]|nr:FtsX-like permease family protein [Candidatus Cloacimonadota bacterium]MDD4155112.1 FtsX-like permease family protein [Candidatus Cloacimonadota bacterium]
MQLILLYLKKFFISKRREWLRFDAIFMYLGIIISVAALTTTFIIFEGYETTLKKTILGFNSHIYFFKPGAYDLDQNDYSLISKFLSSKEEVEIFTPILTGQIITSTPSRVKGSIFKSIDWRNLNQASIYHEAVKQGTWKLEKTEDIVIGKYLSKMLNVNISDTIQVMNTSSAHIGISGISYRSKKLVIVGIFDSGMYEYDSRYIFMNEETARYFETGESNSNLSYNNKNQQVKTYTLIEVKLKDEYIDQAAELAIKWDNELKNDYQISSWMHFNGNLFSLLTLEKWALTIIISFLIIVAGFNVITTTYASIQDKRKELGLLKTIGLTGNKIAAIFMTQICLISTFCIIFGILSGIAIGYLVSYQSIISLKGEVYLLDKIYIHVDFVKMILIFLIAFTITGFAALIPLKQISKMREIDILRYRK